MEQCIYSAQELSDLRVKGIELSDETMELWRKVDAYKSTHMPGLLPLVIEYRQLIMQIAFNNKRMAFIRKEVKRSIDKPVKFYPPDQVRTLTSRREIIQ